MCRERHVNNKTTISDLPKFDILLSGNGDVLSWAAKMGLDSKFIPRSGELSGTTIRKVNDNE